MPLSNKNLVEQIELPIRDMAFTAVLPIPAAEMLYKSFTVDGAEGGGIDMNINGSSTPVSFRYVVPAGKVAFPHRVVFALGDQNIEYMNFAGLGAQLTNGIEIRLLDTDDTVLTDFTNGTPITATREFVMLAGGDVNVLQTGVGQDPDFVAIRWTLSKAGYVPYLKAGQSFEILIQDDLLLVENLRAFVQGRVVSPTIS